MIQQNDIPTKSRKENSKMSTRYFHENINFCIENLNFSPNIKVDDAAPAFKKKPKTSK